LACSLLITSGVRMVIFAEKPRDARAPWTFSNASRRGSSSSSSRYQPSPTCGPPPLWMGVRAATTAMVSQTTRDESAGCGLRVLQIVVRRHSDRSTGGQLNTVCVCVCVCVSACTPAQLHIALQLTKRDGRHGMRHSTVGLEHSSSG